jgi:hypothetical protein
VPPSPSLPFSIAGSKALDSVESFLFVEPAIRFFTTEVSTLVAPAICKPYRQRSVRMFKRLISDSNFSIWAALARRQAVA